MVPCATATNILDTEVSARQSATHQLPIAQQADSSSKSSSSSQSGDFLPIELVPHEHLIKVEHGATLVTPILSSVLVVLGWIIVNKTQANRERRKQLREAIADLQNGLSEIEKRAIEYHSTERQETVEREIMSTLGRFEKACAALPRYVSSQRFWRACDIKKVTVNGELVQAFRKAVTLSHFADEHSGAINIQDEFIQEIEVAASNLQESLDEIRIAALD
jgi:hypothetical protein